MAVYGRRRCRQLLYKLCWAAIAWQLSLALCGNSILFANLISLWKIEPNFSWTMQFSGRWRRIKATIFAHTRDGDAVMGNNKIMILILIIIIASIRPRAHHKWATHSLTVFIRITCARACNEHIHSYMQCTHSVWQTPLNTMLSAHDAHESWDFNPRACCSTRSTFLPVKAFPPSSQMQSLLNLHNPRSVHVPKVWST